MDRCQGIVLNGLCEGRVVPKRSNVQDRALTSYRLCAHAFLVTSISIASGTAVANVVIDGGIVQNVPSGVQFDAAGYLSLAETRSVNSTLPAAAKLPIPTRI